MPFCFQRLRLLLLTHPIEQKSAFKSPLGTRTHFFVVWFLAKPQSVPINISSLNQLCTKGSLRFYHCLAARPVSWQPWGIRAASAVRDDLEDGFCLISFVGTPPPSGLQQSFIFDGLQFGLIAPVLFRILKGPPKRSFPLWRFWISCGKIGIVARPVVPSRKIYRRGVGCGNFLAAAGAGTVETCRGRHSI